MHMKLLAVNKRKTIFIWIIFLLSQVCWMWFLLDAIGFSIGTSLNRSSILSYLAKSGDRLCENSHLNKIDADGLKIAYVMSGGQKSLENRLGRAAELYRSGTVNKIITLEREGITVYNRKLGRNFTNDEWVLHFLKSNGITEDGIELVEFKSGFFGTLAEIIGLKKLCLKRDWHNIIIVSSNYHTGRIAVTAKGLKLGKSTSYKICISADEPPLRLLSKELFKFLAYRFVIIPIYRCINLVGFEG